MKKNECLEMLNSNFIYERDLTGFENFIKYKNQVENMLDLLFKENKSGMYGETPSVRIGRFVISQMTNNNNDAKIWIKNGEDEAGEFDGKNLEKHIEIFFNSEF